MDSLVLERREGKDGQRWLLKGGRGNIVSGTVRQWERRNLGLTLTV